LQTQAADSTNQAASPEKLPERVNASLATLQDIFHQRNPTRNVDVTLNKSILRIGKDNLQLTINSSHDGYVYLVMVGSDAQSFYLLFPNGKDGNNKIQAGQPMKLPRPFIWEIYPAGPAGTDHLLVMVSDSPRKLDELAMSAPNEKNQFTYSLNSLRGRSDLIDFLTGSGIAGTSESFGARLVSFKEVK
jgi:hypothetical protein